MTDLPELVFHEPDINLLHQQVQFLQARLGLLIAHVQELEDRITDNEAQEHFNG